MTIGDKHKIFLEWVCKKYNLSGRVNGKHWIHHTDDLKLHIAINQLPLWEVNKDKYTYDQLCDLFIEVVRKELPKLKGTQLEFDANMIVCDGKTIII